MAFNKKEPFYRQIEHQADLYQPAVYQLLSFYHALETESEPLDGQFIPVTSVQPRSERTLMFAVGILPPPSFASSRLLNRTVDNPIDAANGLESEEATGDRTDPTVVRPNAGLVQGGKLSSPFHVERHMQDGGTKLHQGVDIAANPGAEVRAAAAGHVVSITDDNIRYAYGNTVIIQHLDGTGSLYAHLSRFGDIHVGQQILGGTIIGYVGNTSAPLGRPEPHLHFEVLTEIVTGRGLDSRHNVIVDRDTPARIEPVEWLARVGRAVASTKMEDDRELVPETFVGDAEVTNKWQPEGADNKDKAAKTASQVANKDLNQTNLGKAFAAAQASTAKLMQAALEQMANTPPLRLLVNPQSFRVSAEKLIASGGWGRNGPIIEHWGENQDKIEGSGKIAAYYSMEANKPNGGLTRAGRQFSTSYQNLLSLFLIYKNNGGVWFPDPLLPSNVRGNNLSVIGSVYLYYDNILYIGSFDSLNLSETDGAPFTLEYTFSFTVRAWYLLDHLNDPRYMYGRPASPALSTGSPNSPFSGGDYPQPNPDVPLPADRTAVV